MTTAESSPPAPMSGSPDTELALMRASTLLESDPQAAARSARAILENSPGHEAASLLLASACLRLGDPAAAMELLQSIAPAAEASPILQLELGRALAASGQPGKAIGALERAVALDERMAEAWRELAAQRFAVGDTKGGDAAYARYDRLLAPPADLQVASRGLADGRLEPALSLLRRRLHAVPDDVAALRMLARAALVGEDFVAAEQHLLRCLQIAPGYAAARWDLASELCAHQRYDEALPHLERLLDADAGNPGYIGLKVQALRFYGRNAEAVALLERAATSHPRDAALRLMQGHQLRDVGDAAGAIEAYCQALRIQPALSEAYRCLADLKTYRFAPAEVAAMEQLLALGPPTDPGRADIEFALGKALEDAAQYARSFEHYARGNALFRSGVVYRPEVMRGGLERAKELYTPQFFAERAGWGSERRDPIFIIGMPRSGSTLLEQILASHSQIEGTRELPEIPAIARELMLSGDRYAKASYPRQLAELSRAQLEGYAERYLQRTQLHRPQGKPHFVDKMLANYDHVGLIQLMFPRATIIDARRHPMACCFSCFRQMFGLGQAFSYDQQELGGHYRHYFELMEHIERVLPGRVHRLYYEELVSNPEGVVRRLLDHCGLPFEAGCLKFYENRRAVSTLSSEQVRRPISAEAVNQWRHFEPWLGPLREALGELVDRYPSFAPPAAP